MTIMAGKDRSAESMGSGVARRWLTCGLAGWLAASVAAAVIVGTDARRAVAAPTQTCAGVAETEAQALALASSCGEPVVADDSRTEFAQVVAQPDGRLRFEAAVEPQRARKPEGWADVDLSLIRGGDGRWRPEASVADVAFSGGGSGPLVTLIRNGRTLTMSWPTNLPTPTVSGDSVTYSNVLSDVDLVVRATRTGFTHTLVIKSPTAAANPAVRQVRFGLGGDAQVHSFSGGLRAVAGGAVVASADPAVMWDSRAAAPATGQGARSTSSAAGDAARVAPVEVEVSGTDLILRPDATLLEAPDSVYPLFIDPAWSVFKRRWAYATNDGSSNNDYSVARVGLNPATGDVYRSFFEFATTANGVSLKGKHIESARIEMNLDHSYSCGDSVSSMYLTPAINATMQASWKSMKLSAFLDAAWGHANEESGCGAPDPDMIMNFDDGAVTTQLQAAATGNWNTITVGFTARAADGTGESTQSHWKRFHPNGAKLHVDYDSKPGPPSGLQISGVACPSSGVLTVGTLSPTFSAVFPDADGSADTLTGSFEWIEVPAAGMGAVTNTSPARKSPPPNKAGITPNTRATSAAVPTVANKTYAFRTRGTDRAPYSLTGVWSAWCQFTADTMAPQVAARVLITPSGPGLTGRVRFESDAGVTKFKYGWDAATKEVAAQGTGTKYAEVDVTVPGFGTSVLMIKAVDAALNEGSGSAEFEVGRPSPAIAKWSLETRPGFDQAAALADGQPAPTNSPLEASNVTWASGVRVAGGQVATFNGSSSSAVTSGAVVNTTGSFSVAAWVRLGAMPNNDMKVAVQEGPDAAGFYLGVRQTGSPLTPYWSLAMKETSAQSSATRVVTSPVAITSADVGQWVHLAGAYDATEKKLRLFVNGVLVGEADYAATPWSATGRFVVGRGFGSGAATNWWNGSIADVQVFDRVLVKHDFTGQLASDPSSGEYDELGILAPVPVGRWDFEVARSCYVADLRDTCEAPDDVTDWRRWLALTRGSAVGAGHSTGEFGLWLDDEYFPDEGYTESTQEYGRSAVKTGVTAPDVDGNEFTLWQDSPALRTEQSFTMSAWVMLSSLSGEQTAVSQRGLHESAGWLKYSASNGGRWQFLVSDEDVTTTAAASVQSTSIAEEGVWTHVAAVYDSGLRQLRIYINGVREDAQPVGFTPMTSSGPVLVGRTWWHDQMVDQWTGGIDNVALFQGALNDAAVFTRYEADAAEIAAANALARGQVMTGGTDLRSGVGDYQLTMQPDGNLVLYKAGYVVWETSTEGNPGAYMTFQTDGNVVVYRADGTPLWSTATSGGADRLVLRDDGDLVLLDTGGQVLWRR